MKNERIYEVLAELDREFDKEALDWLISMYDPKSGGMYYAVSSRDNEPFEPDIESTTQTLSILRNLGIVDCDENGRSTYPAWFANGAIRFLSERQDESDGYFYDPLYKETGKKDKKERNTIFAVNALTNLGVKPPYLTAMERITGNVNSSDSDQSMYATKESYLAWLEDISKNRPDSYYWGSDISSARAMITASGHLMTTVEWLKEKQNKENATWENEFNMTAVNGVLKICGYFGAHTEPFPNYETFVRKTVEFTKTFTPPSAASAWNPMGAVRAILTNLPTEPTPEIRAILDSGIADMIANTTVQMRRFRKPDGGFSYGPNGSAIHSNGVKVALGLPEGDVNALALMTLIYNEAYILSGVPKSNVWAKYREYFWAQMKEKYDASRV